MKRFLIVPSLVLAVLLALCILNAAALNRRTNRWMDQADRIAQLAEQQRWDMAREAMDDLSADWESAQDFLHVVIHHETLDAAQVTLTRCRTLCRLRQGDDLLPELAQLCDVFYIGGTKVGALFGEAVVFTKHNTPKHFLTLIKQHGALLAKGFVLGAQFDALFTDNLYFKIARNANEAADRIREALRAKGYTLTFEAPTNQIFVTMDQPTIDRLEREIKLGFTEKADDTHTVMRICTSWATTPEEVDQLIELL